MSKFATKKIEFIKAREQVDQLVVDSKGQLDEFEKTLIRTTFISEFETLLRYIQHHANGNSIGKKLEILKNPTKGGIEYEYKSKHLRIYAIVTTQVISSFGFPHDVYKNNIIMLNKKILFENRRDYHHTTCRI